MGSSIDMIAHCLFHQTPPWERGLRCDACGSALREAGGSWYCPECLTARAPVACPICLGQPWN